MAFALSDIQLTSSAFDTHKSVPARYSPEGDNVSPPLSWHGIPEGTQSFAVICHDPDAPLVQNGSYGFVHWVLYNLPASTTELEEDTSEGTSGGNDFGEQGYGGPMPPEGHAVHHYYFWILALDSAPDLPAGLALRELFEKCEPHLLGMNRLIGTYER
jgi:Raf kinase inhibitor-like YbhB/YbcL family protein